MKFSAVILAGGRSSRMGRDKTWLTIEGESLLSHQLRTVRTLNPVEVFISGRIGEEYSAFDCPVLFDLEPERGALGGIERALHAAGSPLLLVLAVDLPRMTAGFLQKMLARCNRLTGTVPKLDGRLEPLAAIYPKRCHVYAADFIARSRYAAREFAEACLREHAVRTLNVTQSDASYLTNWNSPADISSKFLPAG